MQEQERGRLAAIWVKRAHRGPMDAALTAQLVAGSGIAGSADRGGKRQVTLIEKEKWEAVMRRIGAALPPSTRRANLMVEGIGLANSRGKVLRVGPCRIRIHTETRPCERMDEALDGLREALSPDWCGGACGEILDDGCITLDDPVSWDDPRVHPT